MRARVREVGLVGLRVRVRVRVGVGLADPVLSRPWRRAVVGGRRGADRRSPHRRRAGCPETAAWGGRRRETCAAGSGGRRPPAAGLQSQARRGSRARRLQAVFVPFLLPFTSWICVCAVLATLRGVTRIASARNVTPVRRGHQKAGCPRPRRPGPPAVPPLLYPLPPLTRTCAVWCSAS